LVAKLGTSTEDDQVPYDVSPFSEFFNLNEMERLGVTLHDTFLRIKDARTDLELEDKASTIRAPSDWLRQYVELYRTKFFNLSGNKWCAIYGGHGLERIQIAQSGWKITTKKLKGDVNVPAGKPTFEVTLRRNGRSGVGRIHLAGATSRRSLFLSFRDPHRCLETGYVRPHWGFCSIEVRRVYDRCFLGNSQQVR